ncbi:unnamed protein product [Cochlearia groenlandica]
MGRSPCCDKNGVKKGPWTSEEDQKLIDYIRFHGPGNWRILPKNAGLQRCGKSCRLRWTNYLRPDIKRGRFSFEEEETIIHLHSVMGNKWSAIAARLPGRTDNEIKNHWNTHIRKRLVRSGIDPVTHSPRLDLHDVSTLLAAICNQQNLQTSHASSSASPLLNLDVLRLASLLLPLQQLQPLQSTTSPIYASSFDQNLQTTVTSVMSQPQEECTTQTNNEISSLEATRLDGSLPPMSESLDLDSLMSTPKSSPQHNDSIVYAEANSSSFFDFGFPENFTFEDFML